MDYYIERHKRELKRVLEFWEDNIIVDRKPGIYGECSVKGKIDTNAETGSMYLGRIIFGASAACRFLDTEKYRYIADKAYNLLHEGFCNPAGGYYWGKSANGDIIHDSSVVNMAQANILYGLSEYALLTNDPVVVSEIIKLRLFIFQNLKDKSNGGYLDGFDINWNPVKNLKKSLGTHLHLMEAFVKLYRFSYDKDLVEPIKEIIHIILNKFIDRVNLECIHEFTPEWKKLPNDNWAGHNAETGWLICEAATAINDKELLKECTNISVKLTEKVIEQAFDKQYGGIFNVLKNGAPTEKNKSWWPQAEAAIALLNSYKLTKNKSFLSFALRLIEYIENTINDNKYGEWYSEVSREGMPVEGVAKVHFWKSLYHNVRYYIETSNRINELIRVD